MQKQAVTPQNYRLYAIGDIHGRLDLLVRLLDRIEADAMEHAGKAKRLIFLGDYIDRGIESREVIDRLLQPFGHELKPVFLRGNHEDFLLRFLDGDFDVAPVWLQYGGAATLASYGVNPYALGAAQEEAKLEKLRQDLFKALPESHRTFIENTVQAVTYGDYYFVHAGVRPGVPLEKQNAHDQMWIREAFLSYPKGMGKMIVHGHTIQAEPDIHPNRIGLDTGAYASGHLTCLIMDGAARVFIGT